MTNSINSRLRLFNHLLAPGKVALAGVLMLLSICVMAQPGRPRPLAGPPSPPREGLQTVSTYQGKVIRLVTNDDYIYEGFYILSNNDSLLVKFPPHLGAEVVTSMKQGAMVSVNGVYNVAPLGEKEIMMISINANGKTIVDAAPPTPGTMPAETYVSGNGSISLLQTNKEGEMTGVVVDGKAILRIPPHVARKLGNLLQNNAGISYTGMKKANNNGEASYGGYTIVRCKTITVNGQQYVID